jgi:tripartite-type tricarboxylate transporter receptor subunit TctC
MMALECRHLLLAVLSFCWPLAVLAQPAAASHRAEADPFTFRLAEGERAQSKNQGERSQALEGSGQAYPIKPIRVIVGFAPSGGTDVAARTLGQKLAETLGQSIVVDNRPGAGGTIGDALAATAAPDGYTLLMTANGPHAIAPSLYASLPYNIFRDYASISLVTTNPYVLVVHPSVPAASVKEFIAWLKSNPTQANFSSAGNGTPAHLAGELFKSMAGVSMTHVPYKGAAPALAGLMGGQVNVLFSEMLTAAPQLKSGKVRALAVTTAARSAFVPDLPTISESGLTGYDVSVWYALLAPARTQKTIIARLNSDVVRALQTPDLKERFARMGSTASSSSPAELDALIRRDYEQWAHVIKSAGIKLD